jgi:neutral ceramidase
MCIASGPGNDMFESTKIIAERQYRVARKLLLEPTTETEVEGPVQFIHQWIDMSQVFEANMSSKGM